MAYLIPFHRVVYRPRALPGNLDAATPVEFELSAVGGADLVRLKTLVYALGALGLAQEWTPELQTNVLEAFRTGPSVFVHGIDRIRHYAAPLALAHKAGILASLPEGADPETPYPITTGEQFAKLAGYQVVLALEIALEIARLSDEADIDPRFFGSSTTSPATSAAPNGTARTARKRRSARATAAAAAPTGG